MPARAKAGEMSRERADPGGTAMPGRPVPKAAEIWESRARNRARIEGNGPIPEVPQCRADPCCSTGPISDKAVLGISRGFLRELDLPQHENSFEPRRERAEIRQSPELSRSKVEVEIGPGTMRKTVLRISCENRRERAEIRQSPELKPKRIARSRTRDNEKDSAANLAR